MSIILGYLFLVINILIVIAMTTDKLRIYADLHSVICVIGGTLISAIIAFGGKAIKRIIHVYSFSIKTKEPDIKKLIEEIVKIAKETKGDINPNFVNNYQGSFPMLKESLSLIADGFSKEQIETILDERINVAHHHFKEEEKMFQALAKIPPSFGLLGTTVGLIALFAEIGGADALKKIGPAMAVALTATLYGILTAFAVFNPMLERIKMIAQFHKTEREIIQKGILLLKQKSSPVYVEEILRSNLQFINSTGGEKNAA
jgi:chemotaxis protein MotA